MGGLELDFEASELPGDPGQHNKIYNRRALSPSAEALALIASWTARQPTAATARNEEAWNF